MKAIKAGLFAAGLMFATASIATPITITDPNFYTDLTAGVSNTLDGFNLTGPVSGPATLHVRYGQWNGTFDDLSIVLTFGGIALDSFNSTGAYYSCVFRRTWTAIPSQAGHAFQTKLDSRSVATRGFRFLLC